MAEDELDSVHRESSATEAENTREVFDNAAVTRRDEDEPRRRRR